ncbi:SH3 domain-containing protein [Salinispira pacifica]|uniref:Uncharacterized protein n=1 Tax=Salinispira pacifica TaxID=1307761 RepID=V5WFH5_9SPIO|nr:SH3 domain-containing protein [Salinispira pacifica]AHC14395.1 hypothetical protein L21SP2_0975 [Salinispira pacifica]
MTINILRKFVVLLLTSMSIYGIEVSLDREYNIPDPSQYFDELEPIFNSRRWSGSSPWVYWLASGDLFVFQGPFHWKLELENGQYSRLREWEAFTEYGFGTRPASFRNNDFIVLRYGSIFEGPRKAGIFSEQWEPLMIGTEFNEISLGRIRRRVEDDRQPYGWHVDLLGEYSIINRPVVEDFDERITFGEFQTFLSLVGPENDMLYHIPTEFASLRIAGNYPSISVSFDRFRIAIVVIAEQIDQNTELKGVWKIYTLNVTYEARTDKDIQVFSSPGADSQIIGTVTSDIQLIAMDTANYERNGEIQDFWYQVKSNSIEGWVYGGDLLIEGNSWRDRLSNRGELIRWQEVPELVAELRPEEAEIEESYPSNEARSEYEEPVDTAESDIDPQEQIFLNRKNEMPFTTILVITIITAIILTLLVGFIADKVKGKKDN